MIGYAMGTILIVEDSDIIHKAIRSWLNMNFPKHRVLGVGSAEAAISIAQSIVLDVILMDIKLPQMNGIEATQIIKSYARPMRIAILTMYEDLSYRNDAKLAGVDAFVPKRKMETELLPILDEWLSTENDSSADHQA